MLDKDKNKRHPPEGIIPLTFLVAKQYLEKKYWSQHEAVMLISGHDPKSAPFYEDDEANESWLARLVWRGARHFSPSGKRLSVESWLEWITIGTDDYPRTYPIGFGPELKSAFGKSKSGLRVLEKALSGTTQEAPISIREIKVKGAWRAKIQEAAFDRWCEMYANGSNPSVHGMSLIMAHWCVLNNVKNDYNQHPSAGSIRNTVLNARNWEPPSMSREMAKAYLLRAN